MLKKQKRFIIMFLLQSHSDIGCTWSGFVDPESKITKFTIMFGTRQGYDDVSGAVHMPGTQQKYYAKGNIIIKVAKGNIIKLAKCNVTI